MLKNPRDAFGGQSKSQNMVPFDMLGIWFPTGVLWQVIKTVI